MRTSQPKRTALLHNATHEYSHTQNSSVALSLTICGLEIMFLGAVLFAWNAILYTFIDDGIYEDRCITINVTKARKYSNS